MASVVSGYSPFNLSTAVCRLRRQKTLYALAATRTTRKAAAEELWRCWREQVIVLLSFISRGERRAFRGSHTMRRRLSERPKQRRRAGYLGFNLCSPAR